MSENLWKESPNLLTLSYEKMKDSLMDKGVIESDVGKLIDKLEHNNSKMNELLSLVMGSLKKNSRNEKYRGFLEAMKDSDDETLKETAKKLGRWTNDFYTQYVHTYILCVLCTYCS